MLDTPTENAFDQLTRLACETLDAPMALVSLVDGDRQFFKSHAGPIPEDFAVQRESPLSHSFCRHAVASGEAFVVENAKEHPLVKDNPTAREYGVAAYAGVPLFSADQQVLGTLCVLDTKPRHWTQEQLQRLSALTSVASSLIAYRAAALDSAAGADTGPDPASVERSERLAEAAASYLAQLDAYRRVLARVEPTEQSIEEEARSRAALLAAEDVLEAMLASAGTTEASTSAETATLLAACRDHADAKIQRSVAVASFQQMGLPLEEVERANALVVQTEQEVRFALRGYLMKGV
nr:GAF domain-containing protein [Roseococcus sp. MDT2-1-1]